MTRSSDGRDSDVSVADAGIDVAEAAADAEADACLDCPPPTPCVADWHCPAGEYCIPTCIGLGSCAPLPDDWPELQTPVCTCTGSTTTDPWEAHAYGVLHEGACGDEPCIVNGTTYPSGTAYVAAGDGCNTCRCTDGAWSCSAKPCSKCGAGQGACPTGQQCYPADDTCGLEDPPGDCDFPILRCYQMEATPLCGCNGKHYESWCYARLAGQAKTDWSVCTVDGG